MFRGGEGINGDSVGTLGETPQGQDFGQREDTLVARFVASGDAGWEVTDELQGWPATARRYDLEQNPDIVCVMWKHRTFLLNRTYLGKPRVLSNDDPN